MRNPSEHGRQRGAALIVALLVVAMVVLLGTTLSSDFLLMFRRVENQLHSEQAYAYLLGAEGLARAALLQDLIPREDNDGKVDSLDEDWAQEMRLPTDFGWIGGYVEDAQGRFNINTLAAAKAGSGGQPQGGVTPAQSQFVRLLLSLPLKKPLELADAQALTEAIGDWIDSNDEVSGLGGAESQYYTHADPPGRPGNRDMVSPSELMWVKGMSPEIYRALAPLITVWPGSTGAGGAAGTQNININTAPPGVLACLGGNGDPQPLGEAEIAQIVEERKQRRFFKSVDELRNMPALQARQIATDNLSVSSSYFILNAQTEFQGRMYSLHSLLYRDSSKRSVRVIERTLGEW